MAIDAERLRRIRELFEGALPLDPESRRAFLDAECADAGLRAEVEAVLEADDGQNLGIEDLTPPMSQFRAGDTVGPYSIVERVGVGGIGEVYRARDSRLDKDVAIKVLTREFSADAERFARFRAEARTLAALNHPHIVAIHYAGEFEGSWFLVMEFVEGETLAGRLKRGPAPLRDALRMAAEIAEALEAAHEHEKRIVHRDLKPANVMIAENGVKVLDFGLSQPLREDRPADGNGTRASDRSTNSRRVEGTPPYMSPEQLRGQAPHRSSDVWAFGCVLYEMLAGRPAFNGSGADLLAEIMKGSPDWSLLPAETPEAIRRLLVRCLAKDRKSRLRDIGDARLEIEEALAELDRGPVAELPERTGASTTGSRRVPSRGAGLLALAASLVVVAAVIAMFRPAPSAPPSYRQISFRRGTIWRARFSPDNRTVLYSATWNGGPIETYSTRGDGASTRSEFSGADLLAVSSSDELAILRNPTYMWWFISSGTLASAPLGGGAPRELLDDVQEADWAPDGKSLAVTRFVGAGNRLEYPMGKMLYETSGYISSPRVSPGGDQVAFLDHRIQSDNRGWVAVVDRNGKKVDLSGEWGAVEGLAWSPKGDEIWFSANRAGESSAIYAVDLGGAERLVARAPGNWVLEDVARDGRALVAASPITATMRGLGPPESAERDLSWLDFAGLVDLSPDGSTYVFTHWGEGSGANYTTYLGRTDGSGAIRLGEGAGLALSSDGRWVLTLRLSDRKLVLLPTGPGEARTLEVPGIEEFGFRGAWFPDGERILFAGRAPGHAMRSYVAAISGAAPPRPVTPEGVTASGISPDGQMIVGFDPDGVAALYPLKGGTPQPIFSLDPYDRIVGWGEDGHTLHLARYGEGELQVARLDTFSGYRETIRRIHLADTAGITWPPEVLISPDGRNMVYQVTRTLSTLYMVEGLR
ncbi:MAG TPA: protein kinase [Terriglobia bacterium]|nr:protein kinase [Terriglobia bacterium]